MSDNTRIVDPNKSASGKWRVCTGASGIDFSTERDAEHAAYLCHAAFVAGAADKENEIRVALGIRNQF